MDVQNPHSQRTRQIHMTHVSELFTSNALSILRNTQLTQDIENDVHFVPDVYFSWDSDHGKTALSFKSVPGQLGTIWARVSGGPEWLSLNLSLGECTFAKGDVIGLVTELEGCDTQRFAPFIRTMRDGEIEDTFLQEGFTGSEDRAVQTALHTLEGYDPMIGRTGFHTLVIPLPRKDFQLQLRDLRLFVIPAARGINTRAGTLGSLAV